MSEKTFGHGYALLVGVGEHKREPKLSLPVTAKDVRALQKTLIDPDICGYHDDNIKIFINEEASNSNIIDGLSWLKGKAKGDREATAIIYYSGHGWLSPISEYFLVTQDAVPGAVSDTALPATTFTNVLRDIVAERVLIVLDCCHAQGMAEVKALEGLDGDLSEGLRQDDKAVQDMAVALTKGSGRAVFSSSLGSEKSYYLRDATLSIFTYHFIEALQGAGHRAGDDEVTIASLMEYVSRTVPETVERSYKRSQHPFYKIEATNFPVALIRGGKGLPAGGWEAVKATADRYIEHLTQQFPLRSTGDTMQQNVGQGGKAAQIKGKRNTINIR